MTKVQCLMCRPTSLLNYEIFQGLVSEIFMFFICAEKKKKQSKNSMYLL